MTSAIFSKTLVLLKHETFPFGAASIDPAPTDKLPRMFPTQKKRTLNIWILPGQKSPGINFTLHRSGKFLGNFLTDAGSIDLALASKFAGFLFLGTSKK